MHYIVKYKGGREISREIYDTQKIKIDQAKAVASMIEGLDPSKIKTLSQAEKILNGEYYKIRDPQGKVKWMTEKEYGNLEGDKVQVSSFSADSSVSSYIEHKVSSGEVLSKIFQNNCEELGYGKYSWEKYKQFERDFFSNNPDIKNPGSIKPWDTLHLPKKGGESIPQPAGKGDIQYKRTELLKKEAELYETIKAEEKKLEAIGKNAGVMDSPSLVTARKKYDQVQKEIGECSSALLGAREAKPVSSTKGKVEEVSYGSNIGPYRKQGLEAGLAKVEQKIRITDNQIKELDKTLAAAKSGKAKLRKGLEEEIGNQAQGLMEKRYEFIQQKLDLEYKIAAEKGEEISVGRVDRQIERMREKRDQLSEKYEIIGVGNTAAKGAMKQQVYELDGQLDKLDRIEEKLSIEKASSSPLSIPIFQLDKGNINFKSAYGDTTLLTIGKEQFIVTESEGKAGLISVAELQSQYGDVLKEKGLIGKYAKVLGFSAKQVEEGISDGKWSEITARLPVFLKQTEIFDKEGKNPEFLLTVVGLQYEKQGLTIGAARYEDHAQKSGEKEHFRISYFDKEGKVNFKNIPLEEVEKIYVNAEKNPALEAGEKFVNQSRRRQFLIKEGVKYIDTGLNFGSEGRVRKSIAELALSSHHDILPVEAAFQFAKDIKEGDVSAQDKFIDAYRLGVEVQKITQPIRDCIQINKEGITYLIPKEELVRLNVQEGSSAYKWSRLEGEDYEGKKGYFLLKKRARLEDFTILGIPFARRNISIIEKTEGQIKVNVPVGEGKETVYLYDIQKKSLIEVFPLDPQDLGEEMFTSRDYGFLKIDPASGVSKIEMPKQGIVPLSPEDLSKAGDIIVSMQSLYTNVNRKYSLLATSGSLDSVPAFMYPVLERVLERNQSLDSYEEVIKSAYLEGVSSDKERLQRLLEFSHFKNTELVFANVNLKESKGGAWSWLTSKVGGGLNWAGSYGAALVGDVGGLVLDILPYVDEDNFFRLSQVKELREGRNRVDASITRRKELMGEVWKAFKAQDFAKVNRYLSAAESYGERNPFYQSQIGELSAAKGEIKKSLDFYAGCGGLIAAPVAAKLALLKAPMTAKSLVAAASVFTALDVGGEVYKWQASGGEYKLDPLTVFSTAGKTFGTTMVLGLVGEGVIAGAGAVGSKAFHYGGETVKWLFEGSAGLPRIVTRLGGKVGGKIKAAASYLNKLFPEASSVATAEAGAANIGVLTALGKPLIPVGLANVGSLIMNKQTLKPETNATLYFMWLGYFNGVSPFARGGGFVRSFAGELCLLNNISASTQAALGVVREKGGYMYKDLARPEDVIESWVSSTTTNAIWSAGFILTAGAGKYLIEKRGISEKLANKIVNSKTTKAIVSWSKKHTPTAIKLAKGVFKSKETAQAYVKGAVEWGGPIDLGIGGNLAVNTISNYMEDQGCGSEGCGIKGEIPPHIILKDAFVDALTSPSTYIEGALWGVGGKYAFGKVSKYGLNKETGLKKGINLLNGVEQKVARISKWSDLKKFSVGFGASGTINTIGKWLDNGGEITLAEAVRTFGSTGLVGGFGTLWIGNFSNFKTNVEALSGIKAKEIRGPFGIGKWHEGAKGYQWLEAETMIKALEWPAVAVVMSLGETGVRGITLAGLDKAGLLDNFQAWGFVDKDFNPQSFRDYFYGRDLQGRAPYLSGRYFEMLKEAGVSAPQSGAKLGPLLALARVTVDRPPTTLGMHARATSRNLWDLGKKKIFKGKTAGATYDELLVNAAANPLVKNIYLRNTGNWVANMGIKVPLVVSTLGLAIDTYDRALKSVVAKKIMGVVDEKEAAKDEYGLTYFQREAVPWLGLFVGPLRQMRSPSLEAQQKFELLRSGIKHELFNSGDAGKMLEIWRKSGMSFNEVVENTRIAASEKFGDTQLQETQQGVRDTFKKVKYQGVSSKERRKVFEQTKPGEKNQFVTVNDIINTIKKTHGHLNTNKRENLARLIDAEYNLKGSALDSRAVEKTYNGVSYKQRETILKKAREGAASGQPVKIRDIEIAIDGLIAGEKIHSSMNKNQKKGLAKFIDLEFNGTVNGKQRGEIFDRAKKEAKGEAVVGVKEIGKVLEQSDVGRGLDKTQRKHLATLIDREYNKDNFSVTKHLIKPEGMTSKKALSKLSDRIKDYLPQDIKDKVGDKLERTITTPHYETKLLPFSLLDKAEDVVFQAEMLSLSIEKKAALEQKRRNTNETIKREYTDKGKKVPDGKYEIDVSDIFTNRKRANLDQVERGLKGALLLHTQSNINAWRDISEKKEFGIKEKVNGKEKSFKFESSLLREENSTRLSQIDGPLHFWLNNKLTPEQRGKFEKNYQKDLTWAETLKKAGVSKENLPKQLRDMWKVLEKVKAPNKQAFSRLTALNKVSKALADALGGKEISKLKPKEISGLIDQTCKKYSRDGEQGLKSYFDNLYQLLSDTSIYLSDNLTSHYRYLLQDKIVKIVEKKGGNWKELKQAVNGIGKQAGIKGELLQKGDYEKLNLLFNNAQRAKQGIKNLSSLAEASEFISLVSGAKDYLIAARKKGTSTAGKIDSKIARKNLDWILGKGEITYHQMEKDLDAMLIEKEAYQGKKEIRMGSKTELASQLYVPETKGKLKRAVKAVKDAFTKRELLNERLLNGLTQAKSEFNKAKANQVVEKWKSYQNVLARAMEKGIKDKKNRSINDKVKYVEGGELLGGEKFNFNFEVALREARKVRGIAGEKIVKKDRQERIIEINGKPINPRIKTIARRFKIKINGKPVEMGIQYKRVKDGDGTIHAKPQLETLVLISGGEIVQQRIEWIVEGKARNSLQRSKKIGKVIGFMGKLEKEIFKTIGADANRKIQTPRKMLEMFGEANLEAAMGKGKTIPALSALIANKLLLSDSSGSFYFTKNTTLVANVMKEGKFWTKLLGGKNFKLVDMDSLISSHSPLSIIQESIFSKDRISVGSLQGFAHLFNRTTEGGLEKVRVDNLVKKLNSTNNLKILDEVQNAFSNQQEAIVGKAHKPLLSTHLRLKEAYDLLEKMIKRGELVPITYQEAAKADKERSALDLGTASAKKRGYFRDPSGRVHLTNASLEHVRSLTKDKTLGRGVLASLVEGIISKGSGAGITKDGRLVVSSKYEGIEPDLIHQNPALMYGLGRYLAKAENKRIDWNRSFCGGKTIASADALRTLYKIGGRTTNISGTMQSQKEWIKFLNNKDVKTVGNNVTLKRLGSGKKVRLAIMEKDKEIGQFEMHETGNNLFENIATKIKDKIKNTKGRGKGNFVVVSVADIFALKKAFKGKGVKADYYDLNTGQKAKKELAKRVKSIKSGETVVVIELGTEGLNVRRDVDLFFAHTNNMDLTTALQGMRRINRDGGRADTVHFFYNRSSINDFLAENSVNDIKKNLKRRLPKGSPIKKEWIDKMNKPEGLSRHQAVLLSLHLKEEINRSHNAYTMFSRFMTDMFVKARFEAFKGYVDRHGSLKQRGFLERVYQEVILDHNSELYASVAFKNMVKPQHLALQALENAHSQINKLYDVISGGGKTVESKSYEPTQTKLRTLARKSPFRRDKFMRSTMEVHLKMGEWRDLEKTWQGCDKERNKQGKGNKSPPSLRETKSVKDLVRLGQHLAEEVFLSTIRTSGSSSEKALKHSRQLKAGVDTLVGIAAQEGVPLSSSFRENLRANLDGITRHSLYPHQFFSVFKANISKLPNPNPQNLFFLSALKQAVNNFNPQIGDIHIINNAKVVLEEVDKAVNSLTQYNLSSSKIGHLKDILSLSINPLMEVDDESRAQLYGYKRLSLIAQRGKIIEAMVSNEKTAKQIIADMSYHAQISPTAVQSYLEFNEKSLTGRLKRALFLFPDKGSENIYRQALIANEPIEYKKSFDSFMRIVSPSLWSYLRPSLRGIEKINEFTTNKDLREYLLALRLNVREAEDKISHKQKNKWLGFLHHQRPVFLWSSFYGKLDNDNPNRPLEVSLAKHFQPPSYAEELATSIRIGEVNELFKQIDKKKSFSPEELSEYLSLSPKERVLKFDKYFSGKLGLDITGSKYLDMLDIDASLRENKSSWEIMSGLGEKLLKKEEGQDFTLLQILAGTRNTINQAQFNSLIKDYQTLGLISKKIPTEDEIAAQSQSLQKSLIEIISLAHPDRFSRKKEDLTKEIMFNDVIGAVKQTLEEKGLGAVGDLTVTDILSSVDSETKRKIEAFRNSRSYNLFTPWREERNEGRSLLDSLSSTLYFVQKKIEDGRNKVKAEIDEDVIGVIAKDVEFDERDIALPQNINNDTMRKINAYLWNRNPTPRVVAWKEDLKQGKEALLKIESERILDSITTDILLGSGNNRESFLERISKVQKLTEFSSSDWTAHLKAVSDVNKQTRKIIGNNKSLKPSEDFIGSLSKKVKLTRQEVSYLRLFFQEYKNLLEIKYEPHQDKPEGYAQISNQLISQKEKEVAQFLSQLFTTEEGKLEEKRGEIKHALRKLEDYPQLIEKTVVLRQNLARYGPALNIDKSKAVEFFNQPEELLYQLGIKKEKMDISFILDDRGAILDKLNTAIPLRAQGLLPKDMEFSQISTFLTDAEENLFNASKNIKKSLIKTYEIALGTFPEDIKALLNNKSPEAAADELMKLITEHKITPKLAPPDIDTVKIVQREDEGRGYELLLPLNRIENALGKDGKYGFRLRGIGRTELRHELGHLFGKFLGIPLGESREALWGYNPTEIFALTFTSVDAFLRAKQGNYTLTPDDVSYIHSTTGVNLADRWGTRRIWHWLAKRRSPAHERDAYMDEMRRFYYSDYSQDDQQLKDISYRLTKTWSKNRNLKKLAWGTRKILMENNGTTPIDKEWMKLQSPSLSHLYSSDFLASFYPGPSLLEPKLPLLPLEPPDRIERAKQAKEQ
ncbi:MAG: hypothetical protein KJ569_00645, partial [Candidatus Omnitrophica bacterium]|nr:hypothetical protein [Candidatus Omnitrophota bacterium]